MFGPVRAVIIDDTPSHLFNISSGFSAAGIPCTSYWYDRTETSPKNKLKPKPPENGHEYLRVIFTDLNLDESTGDLVEAIGPVINVVSQLVSRKGGPYAIVFWTVTQHTIESIRELLTERFNAMGIPQPIAIDEIKKGEFLVVPSNEFNGEEVLNQLFKETYGKPSGLEDEVLRILAKYGLLKMLSEWESRAIHAAGQSSNNLFNASKLAVTDSDDITDSLRKVSALVAKEAVGVMAAKEQPAKAYDAALQDILVDSFNQSVNNEDYTKIVKDELGAVIANNIQIDNKENVYAQLNTMFHVDFNIEGVCVVNRGSVIDLAEANKVGILIDISKFCCWEDFFWEPRKANVCSDLPKISDEIRGALVDEMTVINQRAVEPLSSAITSLRKKSAASLREKYKQLVCSRRAFSDSLRWVLIEAGADCDHAQSKSRSLRYLVAAEIPAEFLTDYVYGGEKDKLRNDALKILGPYDINGELIYLLISFKRFVAWQPPAEIPTINIEYRLRKVIIDFILNSYATWSMRPGMTEYKP